MSRDHRDHPGEVRRKATHAADRYVVLLFDQWRPEAWLIHLGATYQWNEIDDCWQLDVTAGFDGSVDEANDVLESHSESAFVTLLDQLGEKRIAAKIAESTPRTTTRSSTESRVIRLPVKKPEPSTQRVFRKGEPASVISLKQWRQARKLG